MTGLRETKRASSLAAVLELLALWHQVSNQESSWPKHQSQVPILGISRSPSARLVLFAQGLAIWAPGAAGWNLSSRLDGVRLWRVAALPAQSADSP